MSKPLPVPSDLTTLTTVAEARNWTRQQQQQGKRVAFVPTMGALHEGHLSLVRRGRSLADTVAVSIFVNPTQFGPQEDFGRYPRTFLEDVELLREEGAAMVFYPTQQEIYGERFSTSILAPSVSQPLEGNCRPGHFNGVCTVVTKLFQIIPADVAVFGQKDFQQVRVIQETVADLNLDIEIDVLPTVREADGLALSSRNRYLTPDQRQRAAGISAALQAVETAYRSGQRDTQQLEQLMQHALQQIPVDAIDYAVVVDPQTLLPCQQPLPEFTYERNHQRPAAHIPPVAIALIAARIGNTRLIDNRLLFPREHKDQSIV